jgi:hypothetical protein
MTLHCHPYAVVRGVEPFRYLYVAPAACRQLGEHAQQLSRRKSRSSPVLPASPDCYRIYDSIVRYAGHTQVYPLAWQRDYLPIAEPVVHADGMEWRSGTTAHPRLLGMHSTVATLIAVTAETEGFVSRISLRYWTGA